MSLDSRSDALPRLLSLAVHEIRTPVSVINGYLRMVLREQAGPLNDKQRHMLEEASRSCTRIETIAREMSAVRTLESGELELEKRDIDVAALVAELANGMHEGEDRGVRLEVRRPDDPVIVTGDLVRLTETFTTLMYVSLRERADSGVVVAHCSSVRRDGNAYALVVFAGEDLLPDLIGEGADSLAFDEYRGGTGYRLPLARRVIERHGGRLWSAATSQELAALDAALRSDNTRLSYTERGEILRKRSTAALRLPLRN